MSGYVQYMQMCTLSDWLQSNDEDGSSFDTAAAMPSSDEQGATDIHTDAAPSTSKPQLDVTAVSAEAIAAGLEVDDVNVNVPGESHIHKEAIVLLFDLTAAWSFWPCCASWHILGWSSDCYCKTITTRGRLVQRYW